MQARNAVFIARSDLWQMLRQRETWIWTFVMPIVFFYFFSMIQSGSGNPETAREPLTLVVPDGGGLLVDELERRLSQKDYEVTRVAAIDGAVPRPARVLEVPAGFSDEVLRGEQAKLRLVREEGGNSAELDRFRVSRAAYSVLADVVANAAHGDPMSADAFRALEKQPRTLQLDVRPAGQRKKIPTGTEQSIPGTMVMFTMILLLTSGAIGVVIDRRLGLLRRLASTPLTRGEIVLGKWLGILSLGLVQIGFGMLAGRLLFHVSWAPDLWAVLVVLFAWAAFNTSLALLLSSFARTEAQTVGIAVLSSNVLAALGGCWWPIEVTPRWMQELANWLPSGWVMNALHRLLIFQTGASGAFASIAWLALGAIVIGAVAARRFEYQ